MSQLVMLVRARGEWIKVGQPLMAGEPGGSLSHNAPHGAREVYLFECRGDHSVLLRSTSGADIELGAIRTISTEGFEEVARMDAETPSFECWLQTGRDREPRRFRFRHEP